MPAYPRHISIRMAVLAVMLLVLLPALGVILSHGLEHLDRSRQIAQEKCLALANDIADDQNDLLVFTKRILQTLSFTGAVKDSDAQAGSRIFTSMLEAYGDPYLIFFAVNPDGQTFASSSGPPYHNYADRAWFKEVTRTKQFTISDFMIGRATGKPVVSMSLPVTGEDGRIASILVTGIGLANIERKLAGYFMPPGSVITIVDHEGTVLAREPAKPELIGSNQKDVEVVRRALTEKQGTIEAVSIDGVDRLVSFTRLFPDQANSPTVYVGIDQTVAYADAWHGLYEQISWLVGLGLFGLLITWGLGGRLLVSPTKTIISAAEQIGHGNYHERMQNTYLVEEFSRISRAFNEMTVQLENRASLLEANTAKLEQEVTSRKKAQEALAENIEKLRRSNEDLEQFAYIASHDLQEPLRIIYSYLQLIERRYHALIDADGQRFIQATKDASERMRALIRGLLDYSRVSTQAKPFAPVDCAEVVEEVKKLLSEVIAESRASVETGTLPVVLGDRSQLLQLFQNLISNAIKYRVPEQEPAVRVGAVQEDGWWRFEVRDNGIGIAPEYHERIFAMFQRLHSRAHYSGTGIGLTICRKIVERHNGRIWVESESGQGSTFAFTLPEEGN